MKPKIQFLAHLAENGNQAAFEHKSDDDGEKDPCAVVLFTSV